MHAQPALLGRKLTQRYYRGSHYCETDVDVASSALAARIVALCRGYAAAVVVDIGIALEGRAPAELPEQCLGVLRLARVDMSQAEPLHDSVAAATGTTTTAVATSSSDAASSTTAASNGSTEHISTSGIGSSSAVTEG
jgi:Protein ENHANCED DISEASE RESISTANCE 2, C-terminal